MFSRWDEAEKSASSLRPTCCRISFRARTSSPTRFIRVVEEGDVDPDGGITLRPGVALLLRQRRSTAVGGTDP